MTQQPEQIGHPLGYGAGTQRCDVQAASLQLHHGLLQEALAGGHAFKIHRVQSSGGERAGTQPVGLIAECFKTDQIAWQRQLHQPEGS
ncbi:MAG: hypothetical protein ACK40L_06215 [Hydrogenophaga sp.]